MDVAPRKLDLGRARLAVFNPSRPGWLDLNGLIRHWRLALRRRLRPTPLDELESSMAQAASRRDWTAANAIADDWSGRAEARDDRVLLQRVGYDLRRLKRYKESFRLIAKSDAGAGPKEWDGSGLQDKAVLIERRKGDLATFLFYVGVVDLAMRYCRKCIVLVDERLAPLYRRTLPGLDVRIEHRDEAAALADADVVTSFEMLAFHLDWNGQQTVRLKPDPRLVEAFRAGYRLTFGDRKLVGIAWGSLNRNKNTPLTRDWGGLTAGAAEQFISLQYGDIESAVVAFGRTANVQIYADRTVDQLLDMDRFAAQVASLDAVVTISNTIAHTAGALGVRTIVLLDDRFAASWPAFGDRVPWYANARLVRKNGRNWAAAVHEARQLLSGSP